LQARCPGLDLVGVGVEDGGQEGVEPNGEGGAVGLLKVVGAPR
jgi:hypothetical protein